MKKIGMAFIKVLCWTLIFLIRLRFPAGQSITDVLNIGIVAIIFGAFYKKSFHQVSDSDEADLGDLTAVVLYRS